MRPIENDELSKSFCRNYTRINERAVRYPGRIEYGDDIQRVKPGDQIIVERSGHFDNHVDVKAGMVTEINEYDGTKHSMCHPKYFGAYKGDIMRADELSPQSKQFDLDHLQQQKFSKETNIDPANQSWPDRGRKHEQDH